ncbi:hypothetical protein [Streptomyces triculaminicus]|uniref:hypothetical protein n=1 Tax=Streptomyces triculaminicus TaxID=2816232 RepID=UPI0037D4A056
MAPASLPSTERRARYYTGIAAAFAQWGRRSKCVRALPAAEHHAPEETHARPAVKSLLSGLPCGLRADHHRTPRTRRTHRVLT